jgi:hypothetical protein
MSQVTGKQHCFWNNKICECIYENRKSNFSHYIFLLQIINKLNKYILFLYCILINYEFWYTFVILSFLRLVYLFIGHDRMVVWFATTYVISAYHH